MKLLEQLENTSGARLDFNHVLSLFSEIVDFLDRFYHCVTRSHYWYLILKPTAI